MSKNDSYWGRPRIGTTEAQAPQYAEFVGDLRPGVPAAPGAPPSSGPGPNDLATPPWTGKPVPSLQAEPGTVEVPMVPIDWFLSTLPSERIRPYVRKIYRTAPSSTGAFSLLTAAEAQALQLDIPAGQSLVLFRYHWYLELPGVGNTTVLAAPHVLLDDIELHFYINGKDLFDAGGINAGTAFSGYPWLTDKPDTHREEIPIFIHGKARFDYYANVVTVPSFSMTNLGMTLAGFQIPTVTLQNSLKNARQRGR